MGRGRETVVYRAESLIGEKKEVAIKLLAGKKHTDLLANRLKHEATMLLLAEHPRVISLYGMHAFLDYMYLELECAPYGDLLRYTEYGSNTLNPSQCELLFVQCLEALTHFATIGLIHRDIKPDNILITSPLSAKIGDLSAATLSNPGFTQKDLQLAVGTISYLAPEILEGAICDHHSDLYSLALTFYHIISGTHPFDHLPLVEQKKIRESLDIPDLKKIAPHCPPYIANIIMKMLSYKRKNRYSSACDILKVLKSHNKQLNNKEEQTNLAPSKINLHPTLNKQTALPYADFEKTTVVNPPTYKIALMVSKPEKQKSSSISETLISETGQKTLTNDILEMNRDNDNKDKADKLLIDEQATQSIPRDVLNRFRMEEKEPAPKHTPLTKDEKATSPKVLKKNRAQLFESVGSRTQSIKRPGFTRLLMAIATCLVVAIIVVVYYGRTGFFAGRIDKSPPPDQSSSNKTSFGISEEGSTSGEKQPTTDIVPTGDAVPTGTTTSPDITSTTTEEVKEEKEELAEGANQEESGNSLTFKKGIYSGQITDLFPQGVVHLSFITLGDSDNVVVLVGLDGWTPRHGELVAENTLKVSSNGIVLQFRGSPKGNDTTLAGTVEDLVTGKKGNWEVSQLNKEE
jgi:serine/threonine protein kinase